MFAKVVVIILSGAALGASLLSLREQRIQAQSELTQAQLRINKQDEHLWMLRTRIAGRVTPSQIETMTAGLVPLHPIDPYNALAMGGMQRVAEEPQMGPPVPGDRGDQAAKGPTQVANSDGKAPPKESAKGAAPSKVKTPAKPAKVAPTRVAKSNEQEPQ